MTETRASIDLGTNTCLLLVCEREAENGRVRRVLGDYSTVVRLGQGVDRQRAYVPEAMARTRVCLERYATEVRRFGVDPSAVVAVTTSSARDAANAPEFFAGLERELGFRFRIISGDEEARATFRGGVSGLAPNLAEHAGVIDIGGGSTEFVTVSGGRSLDIGSVRFTERFLSGSDPVTDDAFWRCEAAIDEALHEVPEELRAARPLVAVAGTATQIAMLQLELPSFEASAIDGLELTRGDLHRWVEALKWRNAAERRALVGMEEGRADVLLAGALILWRALEVLGHSSCQVSTRGLRFGVF